MLRIPALREVPEELPWLWDSLSGKALERAELEHPPAALPPPERERILQHLRAHPLPGNLRALLRLAYRLVAELADPECHRAPAECVELALTSLTAPVSAPRSIERTLAAAFARNEPLDTVPAHEPLPLQHIGRAFQSYLAREIGRLAADRGVPESSLYTGITDRTLRNWKKASAPPDSVSAGRKKNSARRQARSAPPRPPPRNSSNLLQHKQRPSLGRVRWHRLRFRFLASGHPRHEEPRMPTTVAPPILPAWCEDRAGGARLGEGPP
ncbi:hypothetical protein ACN28E_52840 [Archangium lansingense]|uniref:hypothetical protein n=1 Tax=Archangium lansingense TaxID=2995310 RepID=UPI003B8048E7